MAYKLSSDFVSIPNGVMNKLAYFNENGILSPAYNFQSTDGVFGTTAYQTLLAPVDTGFQYPRLSFNEIALNPSNNSTQYFPTIDSIYLHIDRDGNGGNFGGGITLQSLFGSLEGSNNVESLQVTNNSISVGYSDGSITPFLNYAANASYRIDVRQNATLNNAEILGLYFNADAGSNVTGLIKGLNFYGSGQVEDDFYAMEINTQNVNSTTGNVYAARFFGDVSIFGTLNFSGDLSMGKLNAFGTSPMIDASTNSFNPTTIHGLISALLVEEDTTTANADMIGVNTASLITAEANGVTTSGPFGLGCSALALPAVVSMAAGSSIEHVNACVFAINLDAGSTGGTISNLGGCRVVFIPNGITTITKAIGFLHEAPFGLVSDSQFGFYEKYGVGNYFKGHLIIGDSDLVTNESIALEINSTEKALLLSRMTTAQRDLLDEVDGMIIFNTSTNKFQGYASGSWTDLN